MTVKELWKGFLIEAVKEESPHFHLREFNYYANRAVSNFVWDVYVAFENSQASLDYLKALKRTHFATDFNLTEKGNVKFLLPDDYRHLTNCIIKYEVTAPIIDECYQVGDIIEFNSKRLSSDTEAMTLRNQFLKPIYYRPYHQIVDNECEIFTGVHPGLQVLSVRIDYLKTPEKLLLTQTQAFTDTLDTSQEMEFDEITCEKILSKLITMVLERNLDPRTGSQRDVNRLDLPPETTNNIARQ